MKSTLKNLLIKEATIAETLKDRVPPGKKRRTTKELRNGRKMSKGEFMMLSMCSGVLKKDGKYVSCNPEALEITKTSSEASVHL